MNTVYRAKEQHAAPASVADTMDFGMLALRAGLAVPSAAILAEQPADCDAPSRKHRRSLAEAATFAFWCGQVPERMVQRRRGRGGVGR